MNPETDRDELMFKVIGRIAHDFNNLLTPVLAYPSLLKTHLAEGSFGMEMLDVIEQAGQEMSRATQAMLTLAEKYSPDSGLLDMEGVLQCAVELARREPLSEGVEFSLIIPGPLSGMAGSSSQLQCAFCAVIMNGVEAMNGKGSVRLEADEADFSTSGCDSDGVTIPPGRFLRIRISDTGPGILPEVRKNLFEPFVTTKRGEKKRGAGLGLAIVRRAMRQHHGHVRAENQNGGGAVVEMYIPVTGQPVCASGCDPLPATSSSRENPGEPSPSRSLLLVDDEESILMLFKMILSSAFPEYEVYAVENGKKAVDLFCEKRPRLILMDLHMPVMDGQAAFFEIQKRCEMNGWAMPAVLFCTGFAPPDSLRNAIGPDTPHGMLSKPIGGDKLVAAIRSRLP